MASNLRRSKRTVGKRITETDKKVERLRKANIPTRVGDHTITDGNLAADINANKIVAGTIDASVINVTNINANNVNAGILSGIEIRGGTPVGGVYPFRVDTGGNLTSTSGSIGAFAIGDEALTAATFGSMPFDTTGSLNIGVDGEIIGTTNVGSFYGTPYYTTVTINANDGSGIIVGGDASGGYLESRIRSSFITTNQLILPGGDVQTQLNGKSDTTHTAHTRIRTDDGSAAIPAYSFTGDTNTGFYSTADGVIGFSSNGSLRFRVGSSFFDLSDGPIGITGASSISATGAITAGTKLDCNGTVEFDQGPSGSTTAVAQTTAATVGTFCFPTNGQPLANQTMRWKSGDGSSIRFKENINSIEQTVASLDQFWGFDVVEFEYKDEYGGAIEKERPYNHRRRFGFIAEDVEEKVPYLVSYDDDNLVDNVKFDSITAVLYAEVRKMRQFMIDNYGYAG